MKKLCSVFLVFLITFPFYGKAQSSIKAQGGISYIEHFSIGATYSFSNKHNLTLLYGSNFFIKPLNFSSVLLQYDLPFRKMIFADFTPKFGVKGGYAIFTDENYQWQVITVVPFVGVQYPFNQKMEIFLESGVAISFEQAAKRLNYNEVGIYKQFLPELKAGISFTLFER